MKKKQLLLGAVVLVVMAAVVVWGRDRIHFDFADFRAQLATARWDRIAFALGCIYVGYILRSIRWALLVRHNKRVPLLSLIGTQVIGFTSVALIGRVADLARPYLVSKKSGLPLASQIAVYIVERLFDAGSMALIFSLAVLRLPQAEVANATSHSARLASLNHLVPGAATFVARYGGLVLTLTGALFLIGIRMNGEAIASTFERIFGRISKKAGHAAGHKIRTFHTGLDTMRSFTEFASTAAVSVAMWILIALAYRETMRAFVSSPPLAHVNSAQCVLLMVVSGGASIVQLPIIGWFSQIGLVAAAISGFFHAAPEAATACAATLLVVTFLGIVPIGLVWAQFENVSLRKISEESEHAGEHLAEEDRPAEAVR